MGDICTSLYVGDKQQTSESELDQRFEEYRGLSVQFGIFNPGLFQKLDHKRIAYSLKEHDVKLSAFHFPLIDIFQTKQFFSILDTIIESYGSRLITLHPSKGSTLKALKLYENHSQDVIDREVVLAYENFADRHGGKWVSTARQISRLQFPFIFLTYDMSHTARADDVLPEISDYISSIAVVHLSDRKGRGKSSEKDLPLMTGELPLNPILAVLRDSGCNAKIVLETHTNVAGRRKEINLLEDFFYRGVPLHLNSENARDINTILISDSAGTVSLDS